MNNPKEGKKVNHADLEYTILFSKYQALKENAELQ